MGHLLGDIWFENPIRVPAGLTFLSLVALPEYIASRLIELLEFYAEGFSSMVETLDSTGLVEYLTESSMALMVQFMKAATSPPSSEAVMVTLEAMNPLIILFLEVALLAGCSVLSVLTIRDRRRGLLAREYTPGVLIMAVALIPVTAAVFSLPDVRVVRDVGDWSNLTSRMLAISGSQAEEFEILVPRECEVLRTEIEMSTNIVNASSNLIELNSTNRSIGYPVSERFTSSYLFQLNESHALDRMYFLLAPIGDIEPGAELTVRVFIGGSDRLEFEWRGEIGPLDPEGEWVEIEIEPSFLHLRRQQLNILVSARGGFFVWWMSLERYGGQMRVLEAGKGWKSVPGEPAFVLHSTDAYETEMKLDAGVEGVDWTGSLGAGGSAMVEISKEVQEYLSLSPENFKNISVPVKLSSNGRTDIAIDRTEIVVSTPNPDFSFGVISVFLGVVASLLVGYSGAVRVFG